MIKAIFTYIDKDTGDQVWKENTWISIYSSMAEFEKEIDVRCRYHEGQRGQRRYIETWQFIDE